MAEGGRLPWKRQTIDECRGPAADYSRLSQPLPSPPKGVEWKYDASTKEWRLVRSIDDDDDKKKRKYSLQVATTWNPHIGKVQPTIIPISKKEPIDEEMQKTTTGKKDERSKENHQTPDGEDDESLQEEQQQRTTTTTKKEQPVLGKDYLVHTVLPSDTMQGLCLRYKLTPTVLRQVNRFSGTNLLLAPSKLIIPLVHNSRRKKGDSSAAMILPQDTTTREYKMQALVTEFPHLVTTEARAYLEVNDWKLDDALKNVQEDEEWQVQHDANVAKNQHKPTVVAVVPPPPHAAARRPTVLLHAHMAVPAVVPTITTTSTSAANGGDSKETVRGIVNNNETGDDDYYYDDNKDNNNNLMEPLLLKEVELSSSSKVLC